MNDDDLLLRFNKIRQDPWEFSTQMVFTKDESDMSNPVKRFPVHFEYLKLYYKIWQRERLLAVPKSRRMFFSWATLILYLHDTMFNIGRQQAVVSKKEDDADQLIERMEFILKNLPKNIIPPELIPRWKRTFCSLEFPDIDSRITGFPSGADQLRSYAASGILGDESAFWPDAEKMYSAAFPVIETKGRMTMISSAAPGFFERLVHDKFNMDENNPELIVDMDKKFPMKGIEIWKNPKNKFTIFQAHYSANPDKQDPSYKETMRSGMPLSKFNQEYEISWDTFEGRVVFPDWNKTMHGSRVKLEPYLGLPLLVGVDFGLTPSAVIAQLQGHQLVILDEVVTENMGAERFTEYLKLHIVKKYPSWSNTKEMVAMFTDPAGFDRNQNDESTCAQKLSKYFRPQPGAIRFEERRSAVEHFLCKITGGEPNFVVDLTRCRVLVSGFDGGYHFPEKAFEIEPNKVRPLKNEFSHIHDGLQYLCTGILRMKGSRHISIPGPNYNFSKAEG